MAYESARWKDYNLLMVLCLFTGIAVIFCGMLAQILNERIDPRIREALPPQERKENGHG